MMGHEAITLWHTVVTVLYVVGAIALLAAAGWLFPRRERMAPAGQSILISLVITAIWGVAVAAIGHEHPATKIFLSLSYLTWFWALFRLFANDGRHESVRPIRRVVAALAFVELLQLGLIAIAARVMP